MKMKTNARSGEPWTKEEDELVLQHDISDAKLAEKIGRTKNTIQTRRNKLVRQVVDSIKA